jgi:hypothetical protein
MRSFGMPMPVSTISKRSVASLPVVDASET